mgnify:CR=1 FL=1
MMTVNEVSRLTSVSIRALHYYDQIGLLPAAETLVLLTEVTPQSIEAAAKTADWWAGQGARNLRTVFNRVGRRLPRDLGYPHLDAVLDAIGARLLGMIPEGGRPAVQRRHR